MHILIVGPAYPYRGGIAAFNERMAEEFQNQGHQVEIHTFTVQYPRFLFPGKTQYADGKAPSNLQITRTLNSINPINWIIEGFKIKKQKPDILILRFWIPFMAPSLGTVSKIVHQNKKTKIIVIADNIIPHEKRIGDKLFTNFFIKNTDGLLAMSDAVLKELDLFDKQKPRCFYPHPIYDNYGSLVTKEDALKKLNLDSTYQYILFFGVIRNYKGLDLLINAFADERFQDKKIKLLVVGEFYVDSKSYIDMIQQHQLTEKVILINEFIPNDDVKYYFCASSIVAQTYKSATQSGITQIAYHFNRPMLVTNVGGLAEIIPHQKVGYVVNVNVKEIANALIQFFEENKEQEFSENAKLEKTRFSWSGLTDSLINLSSVK